MATTGLSGTSTGWRRLARLGLAAAGALFLIGGISVQAEAGDDRKRGWHGHKHHGYYHGHKYKRDRGPRVVYRPPVYYYPQPRPVYVAPPPVYYAPPPVYYAPAPVLSITIPIR